MLNVKKGTRLTNNNKEGWKRGPEVGEEEEKFALLLFRSCSQNIKRQQMRMTRCACGSPGWTCVETDVCVWVCCDRYYRCNKLVTMSARELEYSDEFDASALRSSPVGRPRISRTSRKNRLDQARLGSSGILRSSLRF